MRKRLSKRVNKKLFKKYAKRIHRKNIMKSTPRGGVSL